MARKARAEVEGGLYHVITRGNNRRRIFNCSSDYEKFLSMLARQKARLPFFLYAYCLMSNHVHLLVERQADAVGQIMHRLLTGYSQYYNRRYRRIGHLLQGRHKAMLCQSDRYLAELVRYIHLNPVRAGMVCDPADYEYSGHRAYLGLEKTNLVDVNPVLRHFGVNQREARARYAQFVKAGIEFGHKAELYAADDGRLLGDEEFVDATIHRIGETNRVEKSSRSVNTKEFNAEALLKVIERVCGVSRRQFCGPGKEAASVTAKEMFVLIGSQAGASVRVLAEITGLSTSSISRRRDAIRMKVRENSGVAKLVARIKHLYQRA
jgi:REP-associated tyrosine transposase